MLLKTLLTLYPYFAMILAAIPSPVCLAGLLSAPTGEGGGGEAELSVREGGGAIAAPVAGQKGR